MWTLLAAASYVERAVADSVVVFCGVVLCLRNVGYYKAGLMVL